MAKDRGDLFENLVPGPGGTIDPFELARRDLKSSLPKRFYKVVGTARQDAGFQILLDGRPVRTPQRTLLAVPDEALAQAIAAEWATQDEHVDPAHMPLTRIVNSALDGVAREMEATAAEIVKYAGSDLLCYRAQDPEILAAAQADAWDPLLDWIAATHGARFILADGVIFVRQPMDAVMKFRQALESFVDTGAEASRALRLAGLHVMTTLTGSAILALAAASGRLTPDEAWRAAHVDEDFQARFWGEDAEARARRRRRWLDMAAAAQIARSS